MTESAAIFRANPDFELVGWEHLHPSERDALDALTDDDRSDLYGILRPTPGSALDTRTCSTDTALLFLTLARPGPLPAYVRHRQAEDADRTMARLVLDDVLQIRTDDGFRSGADAGELVLPGRSAAGSGRIAELSVAALRYAQTLPTATAPLLATRLY